MKNQILNFSLFVFILIITSCSKKSNCQTCTLDVSQSIRVEVCPDGATTYDGNTVVAETELGGLPVSTYAATLELAGYECN